MRGPVLIRVGIVAAQGPSEPRDAAGEAALQLGEGGHRDGKRLDRAERRAVVERKGVLAHAAEEDDASARLGMGLGLGLGIGFQLGGDEPGQG